MIEQLVEWAAQRYEPQNEWDFLAGRDVGMCGPIIALFMGLGIFVICLPVYLLGVESNEFLVFCGIALGLLPGFIIGAWFDDKVEARFRQLHATPSSRRAEGDEHG